MSMLQRYLDRLDGIDRRMHTWILADRRRLRHPSCRCWVNPLFRSVEITQDYFMWRIWSGYEISDAIGCYLSEQAKLAKRAKL